MSRTQALASRRRHQCVIVSTADHERVHQLLVQPIRDLLCVLEQDLLYLPLAYSRAIPRRLLRGAVTSQLLEATLHVDYLCVHLCAPHGFRSTHLSGMPHGFRSTLVELPTTTLRFLTTLPVVLITKPGGLDCRTRTVATVMSRLATRTAAVWVRMRRGAARLGRHEGACEGRGVGYAPVSRPGLGCIKICNYEKNPG